MDPRLLALSKAAVAAGLVLGAGVRIRHDGCHVIPVTLEARLEPVE